MLFLDAGTLINVTNFNVLTLGASCVAIFVTVYVSNRKIKREMKNESEGKLKAKADIIYVDDKYEVLEKDIVEMKADLKSMKDGNSAQHKNLFESITSVGKGVARIEGYLSAKKEK